MKDNQTSRFVCVWLRSPASIYAAKAVYKQNLGSELTLN